MFHHLPPIRHFIRFLLFFLTIFIANTIILFESSHNCKCSSHSPPNYSSTRKTFYKILNNSEDEKTSLDVYSIWCLDMAYRLDTEQYLPQSPVLQAPSLNSTRLHRLPYRYSQWQSSPLLPRRLTPCEHNLAMRLLMIIDRICRTQQITFMIYEGTLLGSLRHHDIIPWDDDIDVTIPYEERYRFLDLIQQMNTTSLQVNVLRRKNKIKYYKLSFKNTLPAGEFSWNFPFVDIFFYLRNETYFWVREVHDPGDGIKVKYVFPLVMRPLGELWLPAPRKPRQMFKFDPFDECKGYWWDHRKEESIEEISIKCDEVRNVYPFAERHNQSTSIEILKLNDTIIHTISYTDKNSFLFD